MMHSPAATGVVRHPCFFSADRKRFGRIHLPVAKACNIQCAYCRRDYDCANENRPGVSTGVISPGEAVDRLEKAILNFPRLSVAGIAGPGDAFCSPDTTLETFSRIRKAFPDIALCVSTNGLNLSPFIEDLKSLGVGFVTITINALDPIIGGKLVTRVDTGKESLRGAAGAELLIANQLDALARLKSRGMTVKVNTVVVPGVNEDHILLMARRFCAMKVDLMNLIPLIPLARTEMAGISPPSGPELHRLRASAEKLVPQMHHCRRCRADAVGCLGS